MSKLLQKVVNTKKGKYRTEIGEGIARDFIKSAPEYINAIVKEAVKNVNPELDFKYHGWRYMTPKEDFENHINRTMNMIDLAKSTLYKIELLFTYKGEEIRRVIALPYLERGAIMYLSDAIYSVVPVLTEYIISANSKEVFVRLLKDKLIFKKMERPFIINGTKQPLPIIYAHLYKFNPDIKTKIPIVLIILAKHGFDGLIKRYTNIDPKDITITDTDVDIEEWNKKGYTVYQSTGIKPRELKDPNYKPHNIKFLIPSKHVNFFMDNLIASLLYLIDRINIFGRKILKVRNTPDEPNYWKVMLGKNIFKNNYTMDKILGEITDYLRMLDTYVDTIVQEKLRENNVLVEDFYDLLAYIAHNFNKLILKHEERSISIENRYADINYYLFYEFIDSINRTIHKINKDSKTKNLTVKDIERIFNSKFSTRKIFGLVKQGTVIALSPVDYSGDNLFTKITSILEEQNRGEGVKKSKDNVFPPFARSIHAEDVLIGNLLYLSKKAPSPRFKINPMLHIDVNTGKILINEQEKKTIDKLGKLLEGKIGNQGEMDYEILDNLDDIDM